MMLRITLSLCALMFSQDPSMPARAQDAPGAKEDRSAEVQMRVSVTDPGQGMTFDLYPDGRVELKLRSEDGSGKSAEKTYAANSLAEFQNRYPDLAKKYEIARFIPKDVSEQELRKELDRLLHEWKDWSAGSKTGIPFDPDSLFQKLPKHLDLEDWGSWIHGQMKSLEDPVRSWAPPSALEKGSPKESTSPSRFGVRIAPLSEALASQLDVAPGRGLLVTEVEKGSAAQAAGIQGNDVLLKLDAGWITDPAAFAQAIHQSLGKGFTLEILRHGKPQTLQVAAQHA